MAHLVRRNQALLFPQEKQQYVRAVLEHKRRGSYDQFTGMHAEGAAFYHHVPSFLPWHREFVRLFEVSLQTIPGNQQLTVPYWDWTDTRDTWSIWADDFMGGNGRADDDRVMTGPFAAGNGPWRCVDPTRSIPQYLRRQFGASARELPTAEDVDECLQMTPYDSPPWDVTSDPSFRNSLEGAIAPYIHNRVHRWVGGNMELNSSPNDPVFFLHHCNLDRLWAVWQQENPDGYLPQGDGPPGQNQNDLMPPWSSVRVSAVLDHHSLGYVYDTENPTAQGDRMHPGDTLRGGDSISSGDGRYSLVYETDGNLVLYQDGDRTPRWESRTRRTSPGMCVMQMNGDLTIDAADGQRVWSLGTDGPGNRLRLTGDGTLEVTGMSGAIAWRSTRQVMA
jgi:tyrosinase